MVTTFADAPICGLECDQLHNFKDMLQLEHEVGGIKQTCIVEDWVETK